MGRSRPGTRRSLRCAFGLLAVAAAATLLPGALTGCDRGEAPPSAVPPKPPAEVVFYCMSDDMPRAVLDAFTAETGIKVVNPTFEVPEEAAEAVGSGKAYDVVVLEDQQVPDLVAAGKLVEIDKRRIPNFRNTSPNFRDLATDPGNRYTAPYSYGTTGLLVRTDLVKTPVRRWADLWKPQFAGKVAFRSQQRELLSIALLALGYPPASEDPAHLEAALAKLIALAKAGHAVPPDPSPAVPELLAGKTLLLEGWAQDYWEAKEKNDEVRYVLPEEGTLLWTDTFVIPAASRNKVGAHLLINYFLRPDVSARITESNSYASANEPAKALVKPELRNDPVIYPSVEDLRRAHFYTPLSSGGAKVYDDVWKRFLEATGDAGAGKEAERAPAR